MLRLIVFLVLWPFAGFADSAGLSPALQAQIRDRPERFEAKVSALILGYGGAKGMTAQGLQDYLAMERARVRVRDMNAMLLADLDDDGAVTQRELLAVVAAQRASLRGRLLRAHTVRDADGDGTVSGVEMRAQARLAATKATARDAGLGDLMQLDFDKDGFVTMQELRAALAMQRPES
ncbi:hypothetical protein [Pseudorhodobacter ferrugineus]|uniref:hypothetical protein n=1 Tax=Pseudorhodobacter ferrugineus TaxID=77008 RepID=UPI0003B50483|nr:hypothetical protein [Pseudorhodobacter ferrugineus]